MIFTVNDLCIIIYKVLGVFCMIETILTRRSIRKYTDEKISEEVLEKLENGEF